MNPLVKKILIEALGVEAPIAPQENQIEDSVKVPLFTAVVLTSGGQTISYFKKNNLDYDIAKLKLLRIDNKENYRYNIHVNSPRSNNKLFVEFDNLLKGVISDAAKITSEHRIVIKNLTDIQYKIKGAQINGNWIAPTPQTEVYILAVGKTNTFEKVKTYKL